MKCMHCQAEMKKSTVPVHVDRKGVHLTMDEVPAWVCSQCGEHYFESADIDSVQGVIRAVEAEADKLAYRA